MYDYKIQILSEMLSKANQEYYLVRVKGDDTAPINLDEGAIKVLIEYYRNAQKGDETMALKVCEHCLMAIESREGRQPTLVHYVDEENPTESRCDWCEDNGFDTLYEIIPEGR